MKGENRLIQGVGYDLRGRAPDLIFGILWPPAAQLGVVLVALRTLGPEHH